MTNQNDNIIKIIDNLNDSKTNSNKLIDNVINETLTIEELFDSFANIVNNNRKQEQALLEEVRKSLKLLKK